MKKRRFRWLVVLLGLTASAIIPVGGRAEDIHWAYEGALGPEHWKDEFPACGGKSQSPVDIRQTTRVLGPAIRFDYKASSPLRLAVLFREGRSHPLLEKVWAPAHLLVPHDRVQPGRYGRQGISLPGDGDPVLDQGPMGRCTTV